jgi:fermentation-respiration switch protein FrsA (DUF1100 family)
MENTIKIGLIVIVILIGIIPFVRVLERKSLFFPSRYPEGYWNVESFGFKVEECFFEATDNTKLHGWFVPVDSAGKVLLWFHGNAGNLSHRLDNIQMLRKHQIACFIIDYRGYGRSEGEPEEQGIYLDAEAAYDFLIRQKGFLSENIILFGRSLGGGVAAELALRKKCAGLILESTFTSVGAMARKIMPILPTTRILKNQFNTLNKIEQINVPVLIIHGKNDEFIPFSHGEKLFERANEPKFFYAVESGHNDLYYRGGEAYLLRIKKFMEHGSEIAQKRSK